MKKRFLSIGLIGVLAFTLMGCGSKSDDKTIKIGVSAVPHEEIVNEIIPDLEAEGYKVEVTEYSDYVIPNTALQEGELDANYFQHIAYLNETNESKGYNLTYTAEVHVEPMGIYSNKIKNISDLKEGDKVAIPNDPSNEARALRLLQAAGLVKINDSETATPKDITENKLNLKFEELEAAQLPRSLDDFDAAVINGNYALQAGLDVNKDGLYIEDKDDKNIKNMRNVLAVKKGNENSEKIQALTKALTSDKVKKFIEEKYKGTVIPVF
ncbi:MAG: MetQ/NlpA family ABC transporter substrate-binding protein [Clostridiales bacterium]|nr:MetQ/NlpA family ABC transporter substrate-binding protein [Clostridiales bacterium]